MKKRYQNQIDREDAGRQFRKRAETKRGVPATPLAAQGGRRRPARGHRSLDAAGRIGVDAAREGWSGRRGFHQKSVKSAIRAGSGRFAVFIVVNQRDAATKEPFHLIAKPGPPLWVRVPISALLIHRGRPIRSNAPADVPPTGSLAPALGRHDGNGTEHQDSTGGGCDERCKTHGGKRSGKHWQRWSERSRASTLRCIGVKAARQPATDSASLGDNRTIVTELSAASAPRTSPTTM